MLAMFCEGLVENDALLSPEGASLDSPGQRPGDWVVLSSLQAPTGRHRAARLSRPFRAAEPWGHRLRGLRPGLSGHAPSGLSRQGLSAVPRHLHAG
jgi:hypothetical protein